MRPLSLVTHLFDLQRRRRVARSGSCSAHSFAMGRRPSSSRRRRVPRSSPISGPPPCRTPTIAAALLNTATGVVYARMQDRVPSRGLATGTLWFLLLSVAALGVGLGLSGAAWLIFLLLVWYRASSILTDLEYWAVAARLYDVRQAKRLFGIARLGRSAGAHRRLVRGASSSTPSAWPAFVLLLRGLSRGVPGAGLVGDARASEDGGDARARFRRRPAAGPGRADAGALPARHHPARLLRRPGQAPRRLRVPGPDAHALRGRAEHLATFFALFSASQVASLLTRVFVSGRFLSRFGCAPASACCPPRTWPAPR